MVTQLNIVLKSNSYLDYIPVAPGKTANQYQCDTNNGKFSCSWKNHSKRNDSNNLYLLFKAAIMRLKSNSNLKSISRRDLVYLPTPNFF